MPRGTRAVFAGELHEAAHHRPRRTLRALLRPDTLPAACWCEAWAIEVPYICIRYLGVTLSCGEPDCDRPGGDGDWPTGRRLFGLRDKRGGIPGRRRRD